MIYQQTANQHLHLMIIKHSNVNYNRLDVYFIYKPLKIQKYLKIRCTEQVGSS